MQSLSGTSNSCVGQNSNLTKNTVWRFPPSHRAPASARRHSIIITCNVSFYAPFLYCFYKFWDTVSWSCPGWSWTHFVAQGAPELLTFLPQMCWFTQHVSSYTERAVYLKTYLFTQKFPIFVCYQAILWKHIIVFLNHYNQNKIKTEDALNRKKLVFLFLPQRLPARHLPAVPTFSSRGWTSTAA